MAGADVTCADGAGTAGLATRPINERARTIASDAEPIVDAAADDDGRELLRPTSDGRVNTAWVIRVLFVKALSRATKR